jgi:hypothetical protein
MIRYLDKNEQYSIVRIVLFQFWPKLFLALDYRKKTDIFFQIFSIEKIQSIQA